MVSPKSSLLPTPSRSPTKWPSTSPMRALPSMRSPPWGHWRTRPRPAGPRGCAPGESGRQSRSASLRSLLRSLDPAGRSLLGRGLLHLAAELGDRPVLELVVDEQVDLLVVEGDQPGDLLALGQGRPVRPGQVLDQ